VVLAAMPSNELAAMRINIEEPIVIAVFIALLMSYARLIRGNLLVEREKEYVQAARATGVRSHRLVVRHLFPNATHGLFVLAASDMGAVVLLLAAFNFIQLLGRAPGQIMMADWA
jgi:peptide/nickel transport system permease protein